MAACSCLWKGGGIDNAHGKLFPGAADARWLQQPFNAVAVASEYLDLFPSDAERVNSSLDAGMLGRALIARATEIGTQVADVFADLSVHRQNALHGADWAVRHTWDNCQRCAELYPEHAARLAKKGRGRPAKKRRGHAAATGAPIVCSTRHVATCVSCQHHRTVINLSLLTECI